MKLGLFLLVVLFFLLNSTSCKKEYSLEVQQKELIADSIICNSIAIYGDYIVNSNLTDTNFVICKVNVTQARKYKAHSDTVNGIYFLDTGEVQTPGVHNIILKGYGRMQSAVNTNFILHFNNSACSFSILPAKAIYTLLSARDNCEGTLSFGDYQAGRPSTMADSVVLKINVTAPGSYSFQTPVINGISFSASGVLTHKGTQTITMIAQGTPTIGGKFEYPIIALNSSCSFFINTSYKSINPSMYYSFIVEGKHYFGYLDSALLGNIVTPTGIVNTLSLGTIVTLSTDTILNLTLSRIKNNITSGIYHSAIISNEDYAGGINFSNSRSSIYYSSNNLPAFQVNLLIFGKPGQLIKGELNGPVINDKGEVAQMTNGIFQTFLSQ